MKDQIDQIIKNEFDAEVLEIKELSGGYSHHMYELKLNKSPNIAIIRIARNKSEDVSLNKEKFVMKLLKKAGISIPKIYAFNFIDGKPEYQYMIIEKFSGIRLDTIWKDLNKEEKIQITKEIGKILSKMHKIKLYRFGFIAEEGKIDSDDKKAFKFKSAGQPLPHSIFIREKLIEYFKNLARLISFKKISTNFISNYISFLNNNLELIEYTEKPTFCHGDFMPGHIFVEKKGNKYQIQGIIDFELGVSSSPDEDFIKLHRAGFFEDKSIKNALEEGYGKKLREKAIEMHRIMRDLSFAQILFDSGDIKLGKKIINSIKIKIKNFNVQS